MKKYQCVICMVLILVFAITVFSACHENSIDAVTTNYLTDMVVVQNETNVKLVTTEYIDDYCFLLYKIGSINNCFVQTIMTPIYNDGSLKELTYTEGTVTSTTISKGFDNTVSTSESYKITTSNESSISWKFGVSYDETVSAKVGVDFGIVSAEAGVSQTFGIAAEIAGNKSISQTEEISRNITKSVNNSYNETYLAQDYREIAAKIDLSDYETGYYYALGLVANIDVYQVVMFNILTEQFTSTYFVTDISQNNTALRMLSSSTPAFDIPPEYQIYPITEVNIDDSVVVPPTDDDIGTKYFAGGTGTIESPYIISQMRHFDNIRFYPDANYLIVDDLDANNYAFSPIMSFSGTLNGGGHKITNLNITTTIYSNVVKVGIFETLSGTVSNLDLVNCNFNATPIFANNSVDVYCGSIAGINKGEIIRCDINNTTVLGNSNNNAQLFMDKFGQDPRDLVPGGTNFKEWIQQSFNVKTNNWKTLLYRVYVGGVVGSNDGSIESSTFSGNVESNLYNAAFTKKDIEQISLAGGIAGINSGTISDVKAVGIINAWIEMNSDAGGMGWVDTVAPKGLCYASGLVGLNSSGSVSGEQHTSFAARYRIYAAVYHFLYGAKYNSGNKAKTTNLTIGTFDLYGSRYL